MSIANLLPAAPITDAAHADALLEIAFLFTAVDGRLEQREIEAFSLIAARVKGVPLESVDANALSVRYLAATEPESIAARVRVVAPKLPAALRETAFKLAIGLALVDEDASPHEDALVGVLFESLGLEAARADELAAEVRALFQA